MDVDKLRARSLMTRDVRTVRTDSTFAEALEIMDVNEFGQLPVMDGTKPVALLREADLRKALLHNRQNLPVGELASALPPTVGTESRLSAVLQALEAQDAILVVSPRGLLRGIITYWDVLVLSRPYLMVTEIELLLRQVVAKAYAEAFGQDWWGQVPEDFRQGAEEEHQRDRDQESSPEHMLGHTSFYQLIESYKHVRPETPADRFDLLHTVREYRNRVAHHYNITRKQETELIRLCVEARDWMESMM